MQVNYHIKIIERGNYTHILLLALSKVDRGNVFIHLFTCATKTNSILSIQTMSAYQNRNRNVDIEVAAHTILTFSRITIITMPADDGSV